jgi:hypothetical protein
LERSFDLRNFDKNKWKSWNSFERHLSNEVVGNSS